MIATWRLILFSLPAIPAAMLLIPVTVHLPAFYARDVGLGLSVVGVVLFITRLWDVIIDPLIGALSDRLRTRFGRRRPWIVLGAPVTVAAMWLLFRPPAEAGPGYLLGAGLLLYLGWTMMVLPYQAWAAELSPDYHERSRIAGWREGFGVIGTLAALVLPVAAGVGSDAGANLGFLALLVVIALPIAVIAALAVISEPERPADEIKLSFKAGLQALKRNGPFKRLILAYVLNGFANGLPPTLFLLYVGDVLKSPEKAGLALVIYFAAGVLAAPFWIWVSKRIGKHWAWIISMIWACVFFLAAPFLGEGDAAIFLAICADRDQLRGRPRPTRLDAGGRDRFRRRAQWRSARGALFRSLGDGEQAGARGCGGVGLPDPGLGWLRRGIPEPESGVMGLGAALRLRAGAVQDRRHRGDVALPVDGDATGQAAPPFGGAASSKGND
jgi:GPH family glycoside/pentoside/hexuronide:cation symporter